MALTPKPVAPAPKQTEVQSTKKTEWVRGKIVKDASGKKTLNTSVQNQDTYFYPKEEGEKNLNFGVRQLIDKKTEPTNFFSFDVFRDSKSEIDKNKSRVTDSTINIDVSTLRKDEEGEWIKPEKQKNDDQVPEKDWKVIKTYLDKMRDDLPGFNEYLDESVKKVISKPEVKAEEVKGKTLEEIADGDESKKKIKKSVPDISVDEMVKDLRSDLEKLANPPAPAPEIAAVATTPELVQVQPEKSIPAKEVAVESGHGYPFIKLAPQLTL